MFNSIYKNSHSVFFSLLLLLSPLSYVSFLSPITRFYVPPLHPSFSLFICITYNLHFPFYLCMCTNIGLLCARTLRIHILAPFLVISHRSQTSSQHLRPRVGWGRRDDQESAEDRRVDRELADNRVQLRDRTGEERLEPTRADREVREQRRKTTNEEIGCLSTRARTRAFCKIEDRDMWGVVRDVKNTWLYNTSPVHPYQVLSFCVFPFIFYFLLFYRPNQVKIITMDVAFKCVHSSSQNLERLYSVVLTVVLSTQSDEGFNQGCCLEVCTFLLRYEAQLGLVI